MIRTFGAYRCFATIIIQFAVRQSYKHVDSLSLIIAYFNLQFHFFPSSIIFLMGIHHLFDGFAYTNRD